MIAKHQTRVGKLQGALMDSMVAIDDWLNTYAAELCDEQRVNEAVKRISQHGTIGYIAHVQAANREALEETTMSITSRM